MRTATQKRKDSRHRSKIRRVIKKNGKAKTETYSKFDASTDHILSVCPVLAREHYIKKHDRVFAQLCFNVSKEMG